MIVQLLQFTWRVQVALQRGQRRRHDGLVDRGHHQRQRDDGEDDDAPAGGGRRDLHGGGVSVRYLVSHFGLDITLLASRQLVGGR